MTKYISYKKRGFTLIELLVVIAIIGILTAIITANFAGAKSKSRDAKRVSDLSQMQLALAGYFDRCGSYPPADTTHYQPSILPDLNDTCAGSGNTVSLSTFISRLPTPPTLSEAYNYVPDTALDDYFLEAILENNNVPSNNSLLTTPTQGYSSASYTWGTCGPTAKVYCVGPK